MNKSVVFSVIAFIIFGIVVGYLVFPRDPQGDFEVPGELVYSNPSIESLDLLVMESFPPQFNAVVKGTVPDSCYEVHEVTQNQVEKTITISIRVAKPSEAECQPIQKTFEELVSIDTSTLTPGEYTVTAGSHSATLVWPEVNQSL